MGFAPLVFSPLLLSLSQCGVSLFLWRARITHHTAEMSEFDEVDRWIEQLLQCKPLSEKEVESLCEKVRHRYALSRSRALAPLRVLAIDHTHRLLARSLGRSAVSQRRALLLSFLLLVDTLRRTRPTYSLFVRACPRCYWWLGACV